MRKMKRALFGMTLSELLVVSKAAGLPDYAAKQMADWLYVKRAGTIEEMTNISRKSREIIAENFETGVQPPLKVQVSSDGTKKYLFPAGDGKYIETAMIPESERNTVCVSSQVGCKFGCHFCMTGKQGFQGQEN